MTVKTKIISAHEADKISADAEFQAYRMLNEAGRAAVTAWVGKNAKFRQDMEPWFSEVTSLVGEGEGEGCNRLEMKQISTNSGRPEHLSIDAEWLDYWVCYNDD